MFLEDFMNKENCEHFKSTFFNGRDEACNQEQSTKSVCQKYLNIICICRLQSQNRILCCVII